MTPGGLTTLLETAADECRNITVPDDPFERDALYRAALAVSDESLALARRITRVRRLGRWGRGRP